MSLVVLPAVPSIVVGLLFILAGSSLTACNPSDAPSQIVPNQHQAAGLTLDQAETPEFPTTDGQESVSGENSSGLAGLAPHERPEIAYFQADTDGDGSREEVYLCRSARVCIKHDGLSSLSIYSNPNWQTVSLVAGHDTDGEAGSEIVVVAISKDASLACICVIHERTGQSRAITPRVGTQQASSPQLTSMGTKQLRCSSWLATTRMRSNVYV